MVVIQRLARRSRSVSRKLLRETTIAIILLFFVGGEAQGVSEEMFPTDPLAWDIAIAHLRSSTETSKQNRQLWLAKAMILMRLARTGEGSLASDVLLSEAKRDLDAAEKLQPADGMVEYLRGILALESKIDINTAATFFEAALKAGLRDERLLEQLTILRLAERRYSDVVDLLETAVDGSVNPQLHHLLAVAFLSLERLSEASAEASVAVALGGGTQPKIVLASAESLSGNYDKAEIVLRDVLDGEPGNRTAMVGLVNVLHKAGKADQATAAALILSEKFAGDDEIQAFLRGLDLDIGP